MQTPPRKGKHTSLLKTTHTEQLTKLQHKNQQELDLLEDIRLFSKSRSTIEKEYAQALVKLGEQFLSKRKFPPPPNFKSEDGKDYKTVWAVWKTVLEETRRVGEMRLQAAETYLQQISEPAKPLKGNKQQVAKKVFDQCGTLQKELSVGVHDMAKSQKLYTDEEHVTHDARNKASDAEEKLNRKSTSLFTSLAKLQQNCSKLNARKDTCEVKSTAARNDYLINLAAANAHQARYYNTDLPQLIQTLDGEMYEKVQDFFTTLARSELECCGLTQECFMKILTDSCMVSREFNLDCFLRENLVFSECVQYSYEPQDDDPVSNVSGEHGAGEQLEKEANKWATRVAKENKLLKDNLRNIDLVNEQATNGEIKSQNSSEGSHGKSDKHDKTCNAPMDTESKLDELRNNVRRAETGKVKAEAVIEVLTSAGVNMEMHVEKAEEALTKQIAEEEMQRKALSTSSTTENSKGQRDSAFSDSAPQEALPSPPAPNDCTYINYEEDLVDDAFDASQAVLESHSLSTGYASMNTSTRNYPQPCVAIYDFTATNADELSLTENEMLEIVADGAGDGWFKARNSAGQEGFVPENYIQLTNGDVIDQNEVNVDADDIPTSASHAVYDSNSNPSSAGYNSGQPSIASGGTGPLSPQNGHHSDTMGSGMSTYSATDYEVQQTVNSQQPTVPEEGDWARALYDYDATCGEELSFQEGQLIRIVRRDENGVDDGWWEGEVSGKVGVFPSLVVEELGSNTSQDVSSCGGPPPLPAPQLAVTQPTPTEGMCAPQHNSSGYNYYNNNYSYKQSESSV